MEERREEKKKELFRTTTIGLSLGNEIEKHYVEGRVTNHEGVKIMSIFDEVMAKHVEAFSAQSQRIEMVMDVRATRYASR